MLGPYVRHDPRECLTGHPPPVRTVGHRKAVGPLSPLSPLSPFRADPGVEGSPQHLRHTGVVLDGRGGLVVLARDRVPRDLLPDRGLPYAGLAEGGQHLRDVGEEGAVRPQDQQPAALDALRERVEQVGGPVQPDGRLPGAGRALHTDGDGEVRPYEFVLVGLDGGGDVAHRADAGAFDLAREDAAAAGRRGEGPLWVAPVREGPGPEVSVREVSVRERLDLQVLPSRRSSSRPVRSVESPRLPGAQPNRRRTRTPCGSRALAW